MGKHWGYLRQVLNWLTELKFFVTKEKCEFGIEEISFLGLQIGQGKVRMEDQGESYNLVVGADVGDRIENLLRFGQLL